MKRRAFGIAIIGVLSVLSIWFVAGHSLFFAASPARLNKVPVETPSYESLLEGFHNPPLEYGQIDCWWWEAGHLSKEKMRWELEELKNKGVSGTWLYPRFVYNGPLRSDPGFRSDAWWDLVRFTLEESQRLGLVAWYSDLTGHQFIQNQLREEREANPTLMGHRLAIHEKESKGPGPLEISVPDEEEILYAGAYRESGAGLDYSSQKDLRSNITGHELKWVAPTAGWLVTIVVSQPWDLDYFNRAVVDGWVKLLVGPYAKYVPAYLGKTLTAYGPDEMRILDNTFLYSPSITSKIRSEKGYEIAPFLVALYHDIGPKTDQIRCDYYGTMSSLLEEDFYKPLAEQVHAYGLTYATIAPLGEDPVWQTFRHGDFFGFLRWFDITGNEDPFERAIPERQFSFAKSSTSIADLYGNKRVGVCGYWGSGWGMTQEENVTWTNLNYAYGMNLFNQHGGFYTLMGGWYEWVPPAVDFYQPYWRYFRPFADYVRRLSYIMSQGHRRPEVALLYPLSTMLANWTADTPRKGGDNVLASFKPEAVAASDTAVDLMKRIYWGGIDTDFIDQPSIERAEVERGTLKVSDMEFKVLVMPALTTIPIATLKAIKDFYTSGGTVVAFSRLPDSSAERGRGDPEIRSLVTAIFGASPLGGGAAVVKRSNAQGGKAFFVRSNTSLVPGVIASAFVPDVVASEQGVYHTHRKVGDTDVYFLFNAEAKKKDLSLRFRENREPEVWDAYTGQIRRLYRFEQYGDSTKVRLEMEPYQGVVVVFASTSTVPEVLDDNLTTITRVEETAGGASIEGYSETGGDKRARLRVGDRELISTGQAEAPAPAMQLQAPFSVKLEPTMDNRWGDFRYPASNEMIGAEADSFKYMEERQQSGTSLGWERKQFDDSAWPAVTYSYGPYWWHIGPFEEGKEPGRFLEDAKQGKVGETQTYTGARRTLKWEPYGFSQKFGYFGYVPGVWGGLFGVSDNFLVFGQQRIPHATHYLATYIYSDAAHDSVLYFGGMPAKADWLNSVSLTREDIEALRAAGGDNVPSVRVVTTETNDTQEHPQFMSAAEAFNSAYNAPDRRQAWVDGESVLDARSNQAGEAKATVHLKKGWNPILLKIVQQTGTSTATYAVIRDSEPPPVDAYVPQVRWFSDSPSVIYDITPHNDHRVGWYRFKAPPGLTGMHITAKARGIEAWINGEKVPVEDGAIKLGTPIKQVSQVALRVEQEPGTYAGAVFPQPVVFECQEGEMALGDWSDYGLETYSGIVVYGKTVNLGNAQVRGKAILDLGAVKTVAEVLVNGHSAGVGLAQPFSFDITDLLKPGRNTITIKVANTLANHMRSYPTHYIYKGQTVSGLLGPVRLNFLSPVMLTAASRN